MADIQTLVDRFTAGITAAKAMRTENGTNSPVVLLTGATGNIGSHILAQLLADEHIGRVYALNRSSSSADLDGKLGSAFKLRGIPIDLLSKEKFVSLAGDVTRPDFGLPREQYEEVGFYHHHSHYIYSPLIWKIISSITHVIHNAWPVSFNLPLRAFEDQLAGVRKLVDLCAVANHTIRLLVTSSVGVASNWPSENGPVPESPISDPSMATSSGYTASKYVVEQVGFLPTTSTEL